MIRPYVAFDDHDVVAAADLSNQIPQLTTNFSAQYRLSVFRDEDKVIVEPMDGMRRFSIVRHGAIIPQAS